MGSKRRSRTRGDEVDEASVERPPQRVRRWKRRLVLLCLLLVALVAAAPTIIGRTGLQNRLLASAMPDGWQIQCEQANLGWLANQSLSGLSITDEQGNELLTVESISLAKSLLSLALNQSDLGPIKLVRPTAYVETRPNGSNWEDFVAALLTNQQEPTGEPIQMSVEVVEATVRGNDTTTDQQWLVENANLTANAGPTLEASGDAELLASATNERGKLKFRWQPDQTGRQQLELLAERLPLRVMEPWLARVSPGTQLVGVLSTDARVGWQQDPQRGLVLQSSGRLEAGQLELATPALASDRLRSRQLRAPWEINVEGDRITINQLRLSSDWADLEANGNLSLAELQSLDVERLMQGQLPKRNAKFSGEVDLAKLAAMLPTTLQLRQGVRIDQGKLRFAAAGQPDGERFTWQANASIDQVAGSDGRRNIRWQEPIKAEAHARETPTGVTLESLNVDAPFAKAELQTQQQAILGNFNVDLAKLSQELSQFVDLQTLQLRGLGEGTFSLARQGNDQFQADANLQLTDLHISDGQQQDWTEAKLEVELHATGNQQELTPTTLNTGTLQLRGPRDQFQVALLQPIPLNGPQPSYQFQVEGNGPLELWAARLRPWVASLPERLEGETHVRAQVQLAGNALQVQEGSGSIVQLRVNSDALAVDEPRVEFSGGGMIDLAGGRIQAQEMQLLGSSFSFRARDINVLVDGESLPTASGTMAFRADLERVASMARLVDGAPATWPRGTAVGQVQLNSIADQLQAEFGMKVEQLQVLRTTAAAGAVYGKPEVVWTEPMLEASGVAKYATLADRLQLDNMEVNGKTLKLTSSASIDRVSTEAALQANGLVEYAPEELAKLVASYAGQHIQLQGDRQVRFQVAGPLLAAESSSAKHWSESWDLTAEAGWSSAGAYGLPLGGGKLQGSLREGRLQVAPLDVAVGRGRFTAEPLVRLTPGAEQLVLRPGPLVTDVAISPEVSEEMLKYVAPILAGTTRAEGEFSINLAQAEVPFGAPEQSRVQGQLTTHRLSVSPGPMMNQLITLVKQVESLTKRKQFLQAAVQPKTKSFLTMNEQQVDFQVAEGRVYHRNLEFLIDDAPVRSYGSVGFDQTLALMIEVPIQDRWIESEPALRGFAGQSLKLPIYGTFQKPKIDERAVADLTKQLLQGAATQAIGDELNRQFEKLFR